MIIIIIIIKQTCNRERTKQREESTRYANMVGSPAEASHLLRMPSFYQDIWSKQHNGFGLCSLDVGLKCFWEMNLGSCYAESS